MTISTTTTEIKIAANGLTTEWTFPFLVPYQDDGITPALSVYLEDQYGNYSLLSSSAYTVSGVGNSAGGYVLYPTSGSALAVGYNIIITRNKTATQPTSVANQSFYPSIIGTALDSIVSWMQQTLSAVNRSLRAPPGEVLGTLPAASARAGYMLAFDSNGNPVASASNGSSVTPASGQTGSYTAVGGELSLTLPAVPTTTWAVELYRDGVRQIPNTDYVLSTSAAALTLTTAAVAGETFWWIYSGAAVGINPANTNSFSQITLGSLSYVDTGEAFVAGRGNSSYYQNIIQNLNSGSAASADIVVSNNLGTAGSYYGDFGINSSAFSGTGSLSLPNATYLYAANGDLVLGTYTANPIHFVVGNGATDAAAIDVSGNFTALISAPGTGAVQRTLKAKLSDWVNILDYGGDPTGTNDSTAALNAAIASFGGTNIYIQFPPGKFKFLSSISFAFGTQSTGSGNNQNNYGTFVMEGAGNDATILYWPATNGIAIQCKSFQQTVHFRGLTFSTGSAGSHKALAVSNNYAFFGSYTAQHSINGCTFRGDDGYGVTDYWGTCCYLFNLTAVNFDDCSFYGGSLGSTGSSYGIGVDLETSLTPGFGGTVTQPGAGTSYNFIRCNFVFLGIGLQVGEYIQAVKVGIGCAFLNGYYGIYVPGYSVTGGGANIRQLCVVGAEISTYGGGIYLNSAVSACNIVGCYFGVGNSVNGISLVTDVNASNSGGTSIVGNTFVALGGSAGDGVYVATTFNPVSIVGNTFLGMANAIETTTGSAQVYIGQNQYYNCTNNVNPDSNTTNIIAVEESVPYLTYTPTVTPGSGSFTTVSASGRYRKFGKTVFVNATATITTNGTAATNIQLSIPPSLPPKVTTALSGREDTITGYAASVIISTSAIYITKYDGTYLGANGYSINVSGYYETA